MTRVGRLLASGERRFERWLATQSPADLEAAIAAFTALDAILPSGDDLRFLVDGQLGFALAGRYRLSESAADLDGAIVRLRHVAAISDDTEFDGCRLVLGQALATRIELSGRPDAPRVPSDEELLDDLTTAIDMLAAAARSDSDSVPPAQRAQAAELREYLVPKLAVARAMAARNAGDLADEGELERVLRQVPDDHPNRPHLILELGRIHLFHALSDISSATGPAISPHRAAAIGYLSKAAELLGPADPQRETPLICLSLLELTESLRTAVDSKAPWDAATADRVSKLTARVLADASLGPEHAGLLHVLAGAAEKTSSPTAAVSHLNQALDLVPESGSLLAAIMVTFSEAITAATGLSLSLDDRDASDAAIGQVIELLDQQDLLTARDPDGSTIPGLSQVTNPAFLSAFLASGRLSAAFFDGDLAGVDEAIGEIGRRLAEVPEGMPAEVPADNGFRCLILTSLGSGWQLRGMLSGKDEDTIRGLRMLAAGYEGAATSTALGQIIAGRGHVLRLHAATVAAELAVRARDPRALTVAIESLSDLRDHPGMTPTEQVSWAAAYGMALIWRQWLTGDAQDLDQGIARLEQADRLAEDIDPDLSDYGPLQHLSVAYRSRGSLGRRDPERAIDAGLRALRRRAAGILLQSGAQRGLRLARWHGFVQVVQLVNWCVADGRIDQAVEALELGRALVLYAATATADIPDLLSAAGQHRLADEWRAESARGAATPGWAGHGSAGHGSAGPLRVPSQLRRQVLTALRASPVGEHLLNPLGPQELAAALRRAGADAFVYLIPPLANDGGLALLLGADGSLGQFPLPGLFDTAPIDAYESAYHDAYGDDADGDLLGWNRALEALCDWAWTAAAGPLLKHAARLWPGRTPRLALIPVGKLGLVPWHAARSTSTDGRPRHALEDAVFCYAASAGQFARAAGRPSRQATEAPVLLANPTNDLPNSESEVVELLHRNYPRAVYFGRPAKLAAGPGTPAEVLARLPGGSDPPASLLHLGCHATVAPSLAESRLLLSGHQSLRVADILAQSSRHLAAGPGFLAVLSACMTDLANTDHDEALTLASALLASGASGVIGARWPVDDLVTAPLMVMFHHFLNAGHPDPADALRWAQLWMLDRDRRALDGLPPGLATTSRASRLTLLRYWAAFTCQGAHTANEIGPS